MALKDVDRTMRTAQTRLSEMAGKPISSMAFNHAYFTGVRNSVSVLPTDERSFKDGDKIWLCYWQFAGDEAVHERWSASLGALLDSLIIDPEGHALIKPEKKPAGVDTAAG